MESRLARVRLWMEEENIDAMVVSKPQNIFYLSGFTGGSDGMLIVDHQRHYLLTDSRYFEQVRQECPEAVLWENRRPDLITALAEHAGPYRCVAVESNHLSHDAFLKMQAALPGKLTPAQGYIEKLRAIKDPAELEMIRNSGQIGDQALQATIARLQSGSSETETAAFLVYQMKKRGCSGESFDTIVLFGPRSALPHGRPGEVRLTAGTLALFDFGGYYRQYTADMSRTFACASASPIFRDRYAAVAEAQEAGLAAVRAGVEARQVHQVVVKTLARYELDRYFVHSTGHGIGLEIHEEPRLSDKSAAVLHAGMVVTVEPGIYIPGWGGIRIEDSVIVNDQGCERITLFDKQLIIITEG